MRDGHLDPSQVMDGEIAKDLTDSIINATTVSLSQRMDDVLEWLEFLEQGLTAPPDVTDTTTPEEDPLEARKGSLLRDLEVVKVLGHGATSRVLHVTRQSDKRDYALKVSLSDQHAARFAGEAAVLRDLHHQRIVQLIEELTLGNHACLLLSLAGARTLHQELRDEGTISLDYAARYGEDLLSALEHLEERGVIHRDIKPANLGVGSAGKSKNHLQLFDFSLVDVSLRELSVGTSAYRDPFLPERGQWDPAADRWSAAVTLHEMLTGVRPSFGGSAAIAQDAKLELAAERFDPAAREGLVRFFQRALHRDAEQRFQSAEQMRRMWAACFDAPLALPPAQPAQRPASQHPPQLSLGMDVPAASAPTTTLPQPAPGASSPEDTTDTAPATPSDTAPPGDKPVWTPEQLAAIEPSTPVEALPLSVRARNALDRAGVTQAHDLLLLADNRLSAIRGVGRKVAREVLELRDQWRAHTQLAAPSQEPFWKGYLGEPRALHDTALPPALSGALDDAGLPRLDLVAQSPKAQVEAIAKRAGFSAADVHQVLAALHRAAADTGRPATLGAWLSFLFPKARKPSKHLLALFGLAPPFEGRLDVQVRDVAQHFACTRQNIYHSLSQAREAWEDEDAVADLCIVVDQLVAAADGALPLPRAAELLLERLPHDATTPPEQLLAQASALFRVAAEVAKEQVDGVRHVRIGEGSPWMVQSQEHAEAIRHLGDAAELLAKREVLASPAEAQRAFEEATRGTPLEGVSPARLADMAAAASSLAARSSRLEIYPTAMPPERTLELIASSGVLKTGLTPEALFKRVSARFPSAAPLPERPELDTLLAPFHLTWDTLTEAYRRTTEAPPTVLGTAHQQRTAHTSNVTATRARVRATEDEVRAREFDDKLRVAMDKRLFRVLGVHVNHAAEATQALSARLGMAPTSLDSLFLAAIRQTMAQKKVQEDVIHAADREGPGGKAWSNLRTLVRGAASTVAAGLLPAKAPLLLTHPGMIARYDLTDFLATLVKSGQEHDHAPCFLLVPTYDNGGVPRINDTLPIAGVLPPEALWVPSAWLRAQQAPTQEASA
jgi:serine/threonine protein kinase